MGSVRQDSSLRHLKGKIGDFIYKWYGKRLVVTRAPRPSTKTASVPQRGGRGRFAKASRYAEQARKDPAVWALYEAAAKKRLIPTRAMAIYDFLTKPCISSVSLQTFHGRVGDRLGVLLRDKHPFKTVAVAVELRDAQGKVLESGAAESDGARWEYATRREVPRTELLVVCVEAVDRFGKCVRAQCTGVPGARNPAMADPPGGK